MLITTSIAYEYALIKPTIKIINQCNRKTNSANIVKDKYTFFSFLKIMINKTDDNIITSSKAIPNILLIVIV